MIICLKDLSVDKETECKYCCFNCSQKESCKESCHGLDLWKCEEAIAKTCSNAYVED